MTAQDDEDVLDLEWWRVVTIDDLGQRLLFMEKRTAEAFARYLLDTYSTLVMLEQWCDGARLDVEILTSPSLN